MSFDTPFSSHKESALVVIVRGEDRTEGGRRVRPEGYV